MGTGTVTLVDLVPGLFEHRAAPSPEMDVRTVRSEEVGDPFPQTRATTGDQDAFAGEGFSIE
jgi:hypothetical protein